MTESNWNTETNLHGIELRTDRAGTVGRVEITAECFEYEGSGEETEFGDGCEAVYVYDVNDGIAVLTAIHPREETHFKPMHLRAIPGVEHALANQPGVDEVTASKVTLGREIEPE